MMGYLILKLVANVIIIIQRLTMNVKKSFKREQTVKNNRVHDWRGF